MKRTHVLVCTGTGCTSAGSFQTRDALLAELEKRGLTSEVDVVETGCMGRCDLGPVALVYPDGTFYRSVVAADVPKLVAEHFVKGRPYEKLLPRDPMTNSIVATTPGNGTSAASTLRKATKNMSIITSAAAGTSPSRRAMSRRNF